MKSTVEFRELQQREQWESLFSKVVCSPLVQDWGYGDAIANIHGHHVRRLAISIDQKEFGLVQTVRRGLVTRINRGPNWIAGNPAEKMQIIEALKKKFPLLVWAPNELSDVKSGLTFRLPRASWRSSWVYLDSSLEQLRGKLDGKWRNQLNQSDRLAPSAKIFLVAKNSEEQRYLDWFLTEYKKLQTLKSFSGLPDEIILFMWNHCRDQVDLWVITENENLVAGGIIFRHGQSATYLAGINTDQGRKIYAHNKMLWSAIGHLQNSGTRSFDLGGVDPVKTPGVAHFKIGMGGENYQLPGEYLCASLF